MFVPVPLGVSNWLGMSEVNMLETPWACGFTKKRACSVASNVSLKPRTAEPLPMIMRLFQRVEREDGVGLEDMTR